MSGTEDNLKNPSGTEPANQSGTDNATIKEYETQIAELRKENAKYRTTAKNTSTEKQTIEEQLKTLQDEFTRTKEENKNVKRQAILDKAGCIKSELLLKEIPDDCRDVKAWVEVYKKENEFLFKSESKSHGGGHKPQGNNTLTPSQKMDAYIRAALGR